MRQVLLYFSEKVFKSVIEDYLSRGWKITNIIPDLTCGTTDGYHVLFETDSKDVIFSSEWRREDIENMFMNIFRREPTDKEVDNIINMIDWDVIEERCCEYISEDIHDAIAEYHHDQ